MRDSERLIKAMGELDEGKIEKASRFLGYVKGPGKTARSRSRARRILILAAVIALILSLGITAYAVYSHWSKGMEQHYHPTEKEKAAAESSGLSVNPEYENGKEAVSATASGVTITVQQTVMDGSFAHISLRIEGYALPEGKYPSVGYMEVTVGGEHFPMATGYFVEEYDEAGNLIFCGEDGSLEYVISAGGLDELNNFEGKEIQVVVQDLGIGDKAQHFTEVEGTWVLTWTMKASAEIKTATPGVEIGDTGVILEEVELTPLSVRVLYKTDGVWEGYETMEVFDLQPIGVRLLDGTVLQKVFGPGGKTGYTDLESCLLEIQSSADRILAPDHVEALIFARDYPWARELTEDELYIVPLS